MRPEFTPCFRPVWSSREGAFMFVCTLATGKAKAFPGNGALAFTGFSNLTGGTLTNDFVFSHGAALSGNLNGGGGGTLDESAPSMRRL